MPQTSLIDCISTLQSFKSTCYCKPYTGLYLHHAKFQKYMVLLQTLLDCISVLLQTLLDLSPPWKVQNLTNVHGVTANLTGLYLHHAKFQIQLKHMVLLQTLDWISTIQIFKYVHSDCKPYWNVYPPCKVSNPIHVHVTANLTRLYLHYAQFQILLMMVLL